MNSDSMITSAFITATIRFGIFAMAAIMFGAWWLGSPMAFKIALAAACLSYLTQACATAGEFGVEAASRLSMWLWPISVILAAIAAIVVIWS